MARLHSLIFWGLLIGVVGCGDDSTGGAEDGGGSDGTTSSSGEDVGSEEGEVSEGTDGEGSSEEGGDGEPDYFATKISCDRTACCAILDEGKVKCWGVIYGYGDPEATGDGPVGDDETPASMPYIRVGGKAIDISVGVRSACVVLEGGELRCWGSGDYGVLGYQWEPSFDPESGPYWGSVGDDEHPDDESVPAVNLGAKAVRVEVGNTHACALTEEGGVRCWGNAESGALGYGNMEQVGIMVSPADAGDVPIGGKAVEIATGDNSTCAIREDGKVVCWGANMGHYVSNATGTIGDSETPEMVGPIETVSPITQVVTSRFDFLCLLNEHGEARCLGDNKGGDLGYGFAGGFYGGGSLVLDDLDPIDLGGEVTQISGPSMFPKSCAVLSSGDVRCWGFLVAPAYGHGAETDHEIGDDEKPSDLGPIDFGIDYKVIEVGVGEAHACALFENGGVKCWGYGQTGELGYGPVGPELGLIIGYDDTPADWGWVPL